ncbi:MAG: T9SS type A sorting domain-containing protein [Candidatus Syntrophosphaera sp.]|nr:T9SS type A sorting domain-containing protein [Candidatus Syntrophosphaera sp.]
MKNILLVLFLLAVTALAADPTFHPLTTYGEAFVTAGDANSDAALSSFEQLLDQTHRGEFIAARVYHASGNLSNDDTEGRFTDLEITSVPTIVFNADSRLAGQATAEAYQDMLRSLLFKPAPVKMEVASFNSGTGAVSAILTRLEPDMEDTYYALAWFLIENDVSTATRVTRQILYQPITLPPAGNQSTFNNSFTIDPAWNAANLWVAVSLEKDNLELVQSASTQALPDNSIRFVADWYQYGQTLDIPLPGDMYNSELFWFVNTGAADNMQMRIVIDDAPTDWYINYCDEVGNCYPGSSYLPLVLGAGDMQAFHLNIWIGSLGIAEFHYEITSDNLGTYTVPFRLRSGVVSAQESLLIPALSLSANSPNPFSGATTFLVNAQRSATASIQVFNSRGQKVDETPAQNLQQGENQIAWQAPPNLPAGVYFYRLQSEPGSLRRMLLLK